MWNKPMWPYDELEADWLGGVPVSRLDIGQAARGSKQAADDLADFAKSEFLSTMALAATPARRWWRRNKMSDACPVIPGRLDPGLRRRQ